MLFKRLVFKNVMGQTLNVVEIPVLEKSNHYYFMVQTRLESFISSLYNHPQVKSNFSFREHLKQKMKWPDFEELFQMEPYKNNA